MTYDEKYTSLEAPGVPENHSSKTTPPWPLPTVSLALESDLANAGSRFHDHGVLALLNACSMSGSPQSQITMEMKF